MEEAKSTIVRDESINDESSAEAQKETRRWNPSEALVIAAVPVMAYLAAYCYELGYCSFFGMPGEFIRLDITNCFIAAVLVAGILYIMDDTLFHLMSARRGWLVRNFTFSYLIVVALGPLIFLYSSERREWIPLAYVAASVVGVEMLANGVASLVCRRFVSVVELYRKHLLGEFGPMVRYAEGRLGPNVYLAPVLVALVLFWAFSGGRGMALSREYFPVLQGTANLAVLRVYGDSMICARYDRSHHILGDEFLLRKCGEGPTCKLRVQKVGPLRTHAWLAKHQPSNR